MIQIGGEGAGGAKIDWLNPVGSDEVAIIAPTGCSTTHLRGRPAPCGFRTHARIVRVLHDTSLRPCLLASVSENFMQQNGGVLGAVSYCACLL